MSNPTKSIVSIPVILMLVLLVSVSVFAASSPGWTPLAGSSPAVPVSVEGRAAVKFPCRFKGNSVNRAAWDLPQKLDLGLAAGVEFDFLCKDPSPIAYFTAYFRSGNGWYRIGFEPDDSPGWQTVRVHKTRAEIEGVPAGWSRIDAIRISAWRGLDENAEFFLTPPRPFGASASIAVIRADSAAKTNAAELSSVRQYAETVSTMLEDLGLSFVVLSDEDLDPQRLRSVRVAILPYNPGMTAPTAAALSDWIDSGGKIFACYALHPSLAARMGFLLGGFIRQSSPGNFASIRPVDESVPGLPPLTRQASWNIYQPVAIAGKSRVVAYWYDSSAANTQKPALVASDQGFFLSHVLLPDDSANKRRMLLAILGSMDPSLWNQAVERSLLRAGNLGPYTSFDQAVAGIAGLKYGRDCEETLKLARTRYELALSERSAARYPQAMSAVIEARSALLRAYCIAQPSMPGEFRGFWCHSASGVEGLDWDAVIAKLSENGFTAVIPNMLWGGVAFYKSNILPVSPQVATSGDLLAQCLAACKKYGLQCHVWKVNFNLGWPTDPAVKVQMQAAGRTQVSFDGKPQPDWLCPSHPENRKLEIDSLIELARNYAVDGLHFDYIRYPDADHCFCSGCRKRFEQFIGQALTGWPTIVRTDPDLARQWTRFRQDQITAVVSAVAAQARAVRPGIKISVAVFRNGPTDSIAVGQDWKLWCEKRYLDFVCPMDYTPSTRAFREIVSKQIRWAAPIPVYPGIGLSTWPDASDLPRLIDQITATRDLNTRGFIIFNLGPAETSEVLPGLGLGITRKSAASVPSK